MSEMWEAQKKYIDASAKCEAMNVGLIVIALITGLSILHGCLITRTAFQIEALEQRVKALEQKL